MLRVLALDRRAEHGREEPEVLLDAEIGIQREAPGHVADALRAAPRSRCTTSRPSTEARPASGTSSVTRMRNSVVLPAPSGPMKPNSSPGATVNDTPSSAIVCPKRFTSASTTTASAAIGVGHLRRPHAGRERHVHRHADLEHAVRVGHADLDRVDEIRALFARLDRRRRELGLRRRPTRPCRRASVARRRRRRR